ILFFSDLDIVGYINNDQSAQRFFEYIIKGFIEYTHNRSALFDELERFEMESNRKKVMKKKANCRKWRKNCSRLRRNDKERNQQRHLWLWVRIQHREIELQMGNRMVDQ